MDKTFTDKIEDETALLKMKKNLILQGAPGVGKTFNARLVGCLSIFEKCFFILRCFAKAGFSFSRLLLDNFA